MNLRHARLHKLPPPGSAHDEPGVGRTALPRYNLKDGRPRLLQTLADRNWLAAGRSTRPEVVGALLSFAVFLLTLSQTLVCSLEQCEIRCPRKPSFEEVRDGT